MAASSLEVDHESEETRATGEIRRVGGSLVLTIPAGICDQAELAKGEAVDVAVPFGTRNVEIRPTEEE